MIRTALSLAALSTFAVLSVACVATPGDSEEATGATSAAVTGSSMCLDVPFTQLATTTTGTGTGSGAVGSGTGGNGIGGKTRMVTGLPSKIDEATTYSCTALVAGPPAAPTGGYAANSISSCSLATATPAPTSGGLSYCTAGYQWTYSDGGASTLTDTWYLCPTAAGMTTLPANTVSLNTYTNYSIATPPVNGCFGAATDTTDWEFVLVETWDSGGGGHNCGSGCN